MTDHEKLLGQICEVYWCYESYKDAHNVDPINRGDYEEGGVTLFEDLETLRGAAHTLSDELGHLVAILDNHEEVDDHSKDEEGEEDEEGGEDKEDEVSQFWRKKGWS